MLTEIGKEKASSFWIRQFSYADRQIIAAFHIAGIRQVEKKVNMKTRREKSQRDFVRTECCCDQRGNALRGSGNRLKSGAFGAALPGLKHICLDLTRS